MAQQYYTVSFQDSAGNPLVGGEVTFQLQQDVASGTAQICAGRTVSAVLDDTGTATVLLWSPATTKPPASYRMRAYTANGQLAFRQDNALSSSEQTLEAPTFSPAGGTYSSAQTVTISSPNATGYYYTLDGSTPTPASSFTTGTVAINSSETLNAIAVAFGYLASPVGSASYVITVPTLIAAGYSAFSFFFDPVGISVTLDTSNANFLIAAVTGTAVASSGVTLTISDSLGNTWQALTPNNWSPADAPFTTQLFYAYAATVGSGQVFTAYSTSGSTAYNTIGLAVMAFSNVLESDPFEAGTDLSSTNYPVGGETIQAGAVTGNINDLIVTCLDAVATGSISIDSGFTLVPLTDFPSRSIIAYSLSSGVSVNPTWDIDSSQVLAANIGVFAHA